MHPDVVVIGAGLCGLTTAYRLQQAGLSVTLVEQSGQVGGKIQTTVEAGYTLEGGPNTFTNTGAALMALCAELALETIETSSSAKWRYIYFQGRLQPVPTNPLRALTTPLLSFPAKLRVLTEPWRGGGKTEESVAAFARRRLGQEVLENLLGPFLSGIYAGDPEQLSYPAVFPKLYQLEAQFGSLLKGLLARMCSPFANKSPYRLLGLTGGMGQLPQALASHLSDIRLNWGVAGLQPDEDGFTVIGQNGETIKTPSVVLATPSYVTARLVQAFAPSLAEPLREIEYAPLAVVHFGLPKNHMPQPLAGFGFLVPRREGIPLLGSIWSSSLFPQWAPDDAVLMTCFMGGATMPHIRDWSESEIISAAGTDLALIFNQKQWAPELSRLIFYDRAIPQYTMGHLSRCDAILRQQETLPGLYLTGNYLKGVALNDCVDHGDQTAEQVIDYLKQPANHNTSVLLLGENG